MKRPDCGRGSLPKSSGDRALRRHRGCKGASAAAAQHIRSGQNRSCEPEDPAEDLAGREVRVVKAQRGDTLGRVLLAQGRKPGRRAP